MGYVSYTHVERLAHPNAEGLLMGECYVFPKLDGTNAVLWHPSDTGGIACGSRRRDLSKEGADDNAGFRAAMQERWDSGALDEVFDFIGQDMLIYGEWLVPHSLKTYREEAWYQYYIFDVRHPETFVYQHYDDWGPQLRALGMNVLEPLAIIKNPTEEDITHVRDTANTYLIEENEGLGEGVVVKNYAFRNHVGKQVWGKSVRNDFKEKALREHGSPEREGSFQVEKEIAEEYVTKAFVEKTRAKVENSTLEEAGLGWHEESRPADADDHERQRKRMLEEKRGQLIPRLLQTVYQELIIEETASFAKKFKDPTVSFKKLRAFTIAQVKKFAADLF